MKALLALGRKLFFLAALGCLAACQDNGGENGAENGQGSIARGRAFAQTNCSTCHAIDATGDSPYAPAPPFRELSRNYPVENLAEALAEGIDVGHTGEVQMPEFTLTPVQIDEFLDYLASLQQ